MIPDPETPRPGFRSGFVAIFGKPNAGKSTLMNALVGEKLAAVSALPQTTRERMHGILTDDDSQIIFVDLPGLVKPDDKLRECLRENAIQGVAGEDAVIHLVDVTEQSPVDDDVSAVLSRARCPVFLALNKVDRRGGKDFDSGKFIASLNLPVRYAGVLAISAKTRLGLDELLVAVRAALPAGGPLYDPEDLTDRDLRYLAAEAIREKIYLFTHEEIPYSSAVVIDEFQERETGKWYIHATIHVEHESQKGIVIGAGAESLKKISRAARGEIERLCGAPVYLELRVKVRKNWTKKEGDLREFGYRKPAGQGRKRR